MHFLNIFFGSSKRKIKAFQLRNAIIIDVRTKEEFATGGIKNAINIPLNNIGQKIDTIKKYNKPVITCCVAGVRSRTAANILKTNGIKAINGGGWISLNKKLQFNPL